MQARSHKPEPGSETLPVALGARKQRVLFVDDEAAILEGLRAVLRPQRREWDMVFALGGPAGLQEVENSKFDIVVTDMRMPILDGAALLARVKELQPHAIRLVLSGQTDSQTTMKSVFTAHQFLAKPCDAEKLRNVVKRCCELNELLGGDELKSLCGDVSLLPAAPTTYLAISKALGNPNTGIADVVRIVEREPTLCAKVLQLANSAFFGLPRAVSNVSQAATYLGTLDHAEPSPFRNADGSLTADGAAGKLLFSKLGCDFCHSGADYTDSAKGRLHDVGTIKPSSGTRGGQPLLGLDTPSLLGIWESAPYLHDGSAPTLRDVLTTANAADQHGFVGSLSEQQLSQLVSFLEQLDGDQEVRRLPFEPALPAGGSGGGGMGGASAGTAGEAPVAGGGVAGSVTGQPPRKRNESSCTLGGPSAPGTSSWLVLAPLWLWLRRRRPSASRPASGGRPSRAGSATAPSR